MQMNQETWRKLCEAVLSDIEEWRSSHSKATLEAIEQASKVILTYKLTTTEAEIITQTRPNSY